MQLSNYNGLHKGAVENFDEVDYMTDVAKMRHEIRKLLIDKYGVVTPSEEGKFMGTHKKLNSFPDQTNRIEKNGAFAIEFTRDGTPKSIVTPYGAVTIHENYAMSGLDKKTASKILDKLTKQFGLVEIERNSDGGSVYSVTKLPWKEPKKSILPWKRNKKVAQLQKMPMPSQIYTTKRPVSDIWRDENLEKSPEYYETQYKNKSYVMPEFKQEKDHLCKLFDVVNARLLQDKHADCIMPGTESRPKLHGISHNFKSYLKTVPNAYEKFEAALEEDNLQNLAHTTQPIAMVSSESVIEQTPVQQTVNTTDLGREM